ncbi:hypothetical protein JK635_07515 [Neobacillus sp. YIM B02564]|uniref:Phage protein n=1 Tax=Neobacillus paridis TaxID=2803862 RepID=A0ABS1TL66_9BACI|nr:hypothetical protein [Neobacillus paridis]MBL4952057.1 hypothetical protein [Neobacillus paridis]
MKTLKGLRVSRVDYHETSRGIAYTAPIYINNTKVGLVENRGDGGMTRLLVEPEYRKEVASRIKAYFEDETKIHEQTHEDVREEVFAGYLIDLFEFGKVFTSEEKEQLLKEGTL